MSVECTIVIDWLVWTSLNFFTDQPGNFLFNNKLFLTKITAVIHTNDYISRDYSSNSSENNCWWKNVDNKN